MTYSPTEKQIEAAREARRKALESPVFPADETITYQMIAQHNDNAMAAALIAAHAVAERPSVEDFDAGIEQLIAKTMQFAVRKDGDIDHIEAAKQALGDLFVKALES